MPEAPEVESDVQFCASVSENQEFVSFIPVPRMKQDNKSSSKKTKRKKTIPKKIKSTHPQKSSTKSKSKVSSNTHKYCFAKSNIKLLRNWHCRRSRINIRQLSKHSNEVCTSKRTTTKEDQQKPWSLYDHISIPYKRFTISWSRYGKTLRALCRDVETKQETTLMISLSIHGQPWFTNLQTMKLCPYVDCYFQIANSDQVLCFIHREAHFLQVQYHQEFPFHEHGPDPILEFDRFSQYVQEVLKEDKYQNQPICKLMLQQLIFNGIGNYLRSEILHRANVPPFTSVRTLRTQYPKKLIKLINLCRTIPAEIVHKIRSPHSLYDEELATWMRHEYLQVYGKKTASFAWCGSKKVWYYGEPGELYDPICHAPNFDQKQKRNFELVGPWNGWEPSIKKHFVAATLSSEQLLELKKMFPHRGRPVVIKGKRGRPKSSAAWKQTSSTSVTRYDDRCFLNYSCIDSFSNSG